jgi:hypothetical protein
VLGFVNFAAATIGQVVNLTGVHALLGSQSAITTQSFMKKTVTQSVIDSILVGNARKPITHH